MTPFILVNPARRFRETLRSIKEQEMIESAKLAVEDEGSFEIAHTN